MAESTGSSGVATYRDRLRLEWQVVAAIAPFALLVAVLARVPLPFDRTWLVAILLAPAAAGVVVLAVAGYRAPPPALPAPPAPQRAGGEIGAAFRQVRRGRPVEPPALQVEAIARVREVMRSLGSATGVQLLLGAVLSLNAWRRDAGLLHHGVSVAALSFGLLGLVCSHVVQRRVNTLENSSTGTADVSGAGPDPQHGTAS